MNTISDESKEEYFRVLYEYLDSEISNFAITSNEVLYDEDEDDLLLGLVFNRGTSDYGVCFEYGGVIKAYSSNTPKHLLVDISNLIISVLALTDI